MVDDRRPGLSGPHVTIHAYGTYSAKLNSHCHAVLEITLEKLSDID